MCSNQKSSCVRVKRFLVRESRDILCSNQKISCVRIKKWPVLGSRHLLGSIKTFPRSQRGHVVVHGGHALVDDTGPDGVEFWSYRPQNKPQIKAHLKQNLMRELMAPSVWPCVVRNLPKFAKKIFRSENFVNFLFSLRIFFLQFLRPPKFFFGDFPSERSNDFL